MCRLGLDSGALDCLRLPASLKYSIRGDRLQVFMPEVPFLCACVCVFLILLALVT